MGGLGASIPKISGTTPASGPAWAADPKRLAQLRERAKVRQTIRDLCQGEHRRVFIDAGLSHHKFGRIVNNQGQLNELIVMFNVIDDAPDMHAAVLVGNPVVFSVPKGFDAQDQSLDRIRSESNLDGLLMLAVAQSVVDGETPLRVDREPGKGTVIVMDSVDCCLPVGPDGHNKQPTVWERRWFVERVTGAGITRKATTYLRVERHRVVGGAGIIEQEAYETRSTDLYVDLTTLSRVPLDRAVPENTPAEVTPTGLDRNTIVRIVHRWDRTGWPRMLLSKSQLGMLDVHAAALSRLARTMEQHGKAKVRVGEQSLDKDGNFDASKEAFVDPDKQFEYIIPEYQFADMLTWLMKTVQLMLTSARMSPALLGIKLEGGAMPDTYDKLRLEATNTLVAAKGAQMFVEPALEELAWIASMVDASVGLGGWPVGEVDVTLRPEIPADEIDRGRAILELYQGGLMDQETAVERFHGTGAAPTVIQRLNAESDARVARERAAVFGATGGGAFGGGAL